MTDETARLRRNLDADELDPRLDSFVRSAARVDDAATAELLAATRRGDAAARDRLIRSNMRLVGFVARRHAGRGVAMDDLIGWGTLGLIRAVDGYDESGGASFGHWAFVCIASEIRNAVRRAARPGVAAARALRDGELIDADVIDVAKPRSAALDFDLDCRAGFASLTPLERVVVRNLYGVGGQPVVNRVGLAKSMGCSPQWVGVLEGNALRKLRRARTL